MNVWVDVNGALKAPNRLGRDLFGVIVTNGKVLPMGLYGTSLAPNSGSSCDSTDKFIPMGSSGKASDYAGASCSSQFCLKM